MVLLSPPLLLIVPDGLQARVPANLIWTQQRVTAACQLKIPPCFIIFSPRRFKTYDTGFFSFYGCQIKVMSDLSHKIQPIHIVVIFSTVHFLYTVTEQMEKYESDHKHCLPWSGLSFPFFTKTDASCASRFCIQMDLNHQDPRHTYSLHTSTVSNTQIIHLVKLAELE